MKKKLEWFCKSHDKALCVVCLPTKHRSCSDVIPIDVAATNSRQSTAISDLQEAIEVTLRNIQLCINNRNTATKDIENQEKDIKRIIRDTRTKINSHLDELEEKLIQAFVSASETCKSKYNKFLQQFHSQEEKLFKLKDQVLQMKKFASDLQVFLGTRQIDKLVISETESIIKIATDSTNDYKFNLVLNSDIQKLSNGLVKEFGEIQVTDHTTNLQLKELKIEQAQMQQTIQPLSTVAGINLQVITKVDMKGEANMYVTGCAILPNGHLLFANNANSKLLKYSEAGYFIGSIQVSAVPYDITVLDCDRIVITYGGNKFFEIFNHRTNRIEKKVEPGFHCWGLSQSNGNIYVRHTQAVGVFDNMGNQQSTLDAAGKVYISASINNMFCSKSSNHNVYYYDANGQEVWRFQNYHLQHPLGVSNDHIGNVFVIGSLSRNLILIQHDGKSYKNLLSFENKSSPRVLCYNKNKNTLLVCDKDGDHCVLYKVLYTS